MDLYEFQGKKFFAEYGIKVPQGTVITSPEDALPDMPAGGVVKTQVLTGGRGKAGGVIICNNNEEIKAAVQKLFGMDIKGHEAHQLLIEEKADIAKEFYFSIFINRAHKVPSLMFSASGGMNIESVPKDQIAIVDVNPLLGIQDYMITTLLNRFDLDCKAGIADVIKKAWKLFTDKKLQLLEINPLIETKDGEVMALDSKITMDDWAIDPSIDTKRQEGGTQTEFERKMIPYGMMAVEMDGDVIVYSSGAGVAMATADCVAARGVKFHNGAEMTAEDVAFSINRALESPNVSGTAGMMKNAEVVDDTHVKVNMEYAYAPVLNLFVHTAFSILNKEYVEKCEADGTNMGRNPIGTGAYKFVSWQNGSNIKLTKNEEWHMGDVAIPNVEFSFMADATTGAIALEAGDCDVFYGVDSADLPRLRENPDVDVLSVQSSGYYFIACNTEAGALSDVRVRQAIAKAVNRQEIIDGGQDGVGWVTEVPITPGIFGYLEDFHAFEQDIDGAKALLAEAGYADGLTLSMKCPETSYYARPAQVIQEELRQVGITVELTPMERGAFTTDVTNRDYELIYNWVGAQFPDADTIVSLIFNKDLAHEGSTTNMALINDDKAQELWQAGRVALDPQERLDIYRELCELNKEQSWYIPILTSTNSICARSYVGGCYGHASCYYHVSDWSF